MVQKLFEWACGGGREHFRTEEGGATRTHSYTLPRLTRAARLRPELARTGKSLVDAFEMALVDAPRTSVQ